MKKKPLFWVLLPSYLAVTLLAVASVALYAFHSMSNLYFQALEKDIQIRAQLLGEQIAPLLKDKKYNQIDVRCKALGKSAETRFTVVLADGRVIGDSWEDPASMENHYNRPEIRQALERNAGFSKRYSRTVKEKMIYVAKPLYSSNKQVLCAVRAALPMIAIKNELNTMTRQLLFVTVLIALFSAMVCVWVVRRLTHPLRSMEKAARQFSKGDFSARVPAQRATELNRLAESLNSMSEQLNKTLSSLNEQRNEQQAMLSSMDEAVIAVDRKERIIHMNRIAGKLLNIDPKKAKRELIQTLIHFMNVQKFIKAVLSSDKPVSKDLILDGETEKQVHAHGTILRDADDQAIGALIVLRDQTQLRHLETVRSDFVANVSHELKTPITSIKGFIETLLSDDWNHSPEAVRFLEIINQQTTRLDAIIDDLLTLSRLEQKEVHVLTQPTDLGSVISNAIDLCHLQAEKKEMTIQTDLPEEMLLSVNAPLLEQALVNLLTNAIKYSDPKKTIKISVEKQSDHSVILAVKDEGFGIETSHRNRLFERFYRVDTARSRSLGGTGLGLSIVKHIAQVHGAQVHVESQPGKGSTFSIIFPS